MVNAQIYGMKEITKILKNFPIKVRRNALKGALKAGAKPVLEEAKRRVPVKSGSLKNSLDIVTRKTKDEDVLMVSVLPRSSKTKTKRLKLSNGKTWKIKGQVGSGWYAHFVEYGTYAKRAVPLQRKRGKKAQKVANKGLGAAAHPFMEPAADKHQEAYIEARKYLAKRAAKLIRESK